MSLISRGRRFRVSWGSVVGGEDAVLGRRGRVVPECGETSWHFRWRGGMCWDCGKWEGVSMGVRRSGGMEVVGEGQ